LRGRLEKKQEKSPLVDLQNRLDRTVGEISGTLRRSEGNERELLIRTVEDHAAQIVDAVRQILEDATKPA
jgi:hypothetical protein